MTRKNEGQVPKSYPGAEEWVPESGAECCTYSEEQPAPGRLLASQPRLGDVRATVCFHFSRLARCSGTVSLSRD